MAKVKIQGNASGTGVLTVTAPNTSTDRVITLPDSTSTLATTADSVGGANGVDFNDDVKARFGTGNDLELYHNGSHSYIKDAGTGNLHLLTNHLSVNNAADTEAIIHATQDAGVSLFHNNVKKLETTATGVAVTGGVAIGGTGTANTLDDYEEGTWTPSLGANSGRSGTWSSAIGIYTKIGNIVHLYLGITGSAMYFTSELGYQHITGLPFTASNPSGLSNYSGSWSGDAVTRSSGGHLYLHTTNLYMHARNESPSTLGADGFGCYISYTTT